MLSLLLFFTLLLSSKLMFFSVLGFNSNAMFLASIFLVVLIVCSTRVRFNKLNILVLSFSLISFFIFNMVKYSGDLVFPFGYYPTDMFIILSLFFVFFSNGKVLFKGLNYYLNFMALSLVIGIFLYLLFTFDLIKPIGVVSAVDHASSAGYLNLYYFSYLPSWIEMKFSGLTIYRFSGVFWEPGTMALYLIMFITIDFCFLRVIRSRWITFRLFVYFISGFFSFSALFILMAPFLVFIYLIIKKKYFVIIACSCVVILFAFIFFDIVNQLILYRFHYDPVRGFVGNTRATIYSDFIQSFSQLPILNLFFGSGPDLTNTGVTVSFFTKIYQRGIIGTVMILVPFLILYFKSSSVIRLILLPFIISLLTLTQIEGVLSFLLFVILIKPSKDRYVIS
ncbi:MULTISPECIES: hypothetical protein [Bacteria]|uniref:hypothetical protein n=1 Tax=Bacteria TaxID=2 RepID=UPI001866CD84|nr:hypothetical protein [Vibrio litoralis]